MRYYSIILFVSLLAFLLPLNSQAQIGPGGVGNADGSDGQPQLHFWLRADSAGLSDGDPVDVWPDVSGNGNDFSQPTAAERPTYVFNGIGGQPSVEYDGSDMSLVDEDGETYINGQSAFTLMAVVQSDVTGTDAGFFDGEDPNGNDNVLTIRYDDIGADEGGDDVIKAGITVGSETNVESSENLQTTSPQMLTMQWQSGSVIDLYADGTLDTPTSASSNPIGNLQDATRAIIGKASKDAGVSWDGQIGEMLFFSNRLNSARRTIVENYFSVKYGIDIGNDRMTGNDASYVHNLIGIGNESDGEQVSAYAKGLRIEENGDFGGGDYVLATHDNATNDIASIRTGAEIMAAGAEAAWNRDWYIEKTGSLQSRISLNIQEGIEGGKYPGETSHYVLLYRSGTTGDYTSLGSADGTSGGEEVYFDLTDAELQNGYYTLGSTDQNTSPVEGKEGRTWYSLVSGDWEDWETWTLDPSGALPNNPDQETPQGDASDQVVILTGRTVAVNTDNLENVSLTVRGRLDFQNTQGHSFSEIRGSGRILLQGDHFPAGDASHFVTAGEGEGTVVFYGSGLTLSQRAETFYDVEVDMNATSDVVTLVNDYTLNGDLWVKQGELQINDNSTTTPLRLDVAGDVLVSSSGSISVGTADAWDSGLASGYGNYHKGFHVFRVGGDFTNNGSVRLTNLAEPDYATRATSGAASLVFYSSADKKLTCNNTTDLYNLVVDKGSDRTYQLEVYADAKADFALFGQNDDEWDDTDAAHPENRKALWVANGTLRFTGAVYIPTLTEGTRDYTIGERAALVLDGPNVFVGNTANENTDWTGLSHGDTEPAGVDDGGSQQGIYPFGKLQVDRGHYYQGESESINFRDEAPGIIEVNGGLLEANQIAISSSASSGDFSFVLNGGEIRITREYGGDGTRAILNLDQPDMNFTMTGGDLYIEAVTGHTPGGIHISSSEGNHNVTGGTLHIQNGGGCEVQSTAPFYDVEIVSGSSLNVLNEPLSALGSLTIQNNATLNSNDNDVLIGNDFDFQDGATYNHGSNTTHFTGDQFAGVNVRNTSNPGDLTFNNITVSKDQRYNPDLYYSVEIHSGGSRDAADHPVEIQGDLTIERGEFDVNQWEVDIQGNIQIDDGNLISTNDSPGRMVLNGSAQQTLEGSVAGDQNFGYLELDNTNGALLLSDIDVTDLTITTGIFSLDIYNLDVSGSLIDQTATGYDASNMIQTAGNASDGGLSLFLNLSEGGAGTETLFPIGTGAGYNPARVTQSATIADSGKITINPVEDYHPSSTDPSKTIEYYWVVDTTGFSSVTYDQLGYTFTYNSGTIPGSVNKGLNLWPEDYTWYSHNNVVNGSDLEFPYEAYLRSDFTVGNKSEFNQPIIYYSRQVSQDYNIGSMPQWSDGDTWSTESHTGAAADDWPQDGDIAIIGYGGSGGGSGGNRHHVAYRASDNYDLAKVIIDASEDPAVWSSRLFVEEGATFDMGVVEGDGTLQLLIDPSNPGNISGDFGDFTGNYQEGARVLYYGVSGSLITLPDIFNQLPNVRIEGGSNRTFTFPRELTVMGYLRVDHQATLRLEYDLTVNGDLRLGNHKEGTLEFPDDVSRTVTVNSDFRVTSDGDSEVAVDNATANGLEHRLRVAGNIELSQGNRFDLFTNNSGGNNVILEIFGQSAAELSNTDDMPVELYRLEMNKQQGTDFSIYRDPDDTGVSMSNFSINGPTDSDPKAIELISGRLRLEDAGIDVTLTSGGADFNIPAEATLLAKHNATVRTSGSNTGILLDGSIEASYASNWFLNGGTNNYIEYTASGNAEIDIYQADFYVGSQIRRNTVTDGGILQFRQNHANSTVVIGTNADAGGEPSRGVFEILNSGSYFSQVANARITIANGVTNATAPDLNVDVDASQVDLAEGSEIAFGSTSTSADQNLGLRSAVPLKNLVLDNTSGNNPRVTMEILSLAADTLTIGAGTAYDANGLDLTLEGDMAVNGTYEANGNITYFSGNNNQQIIGNTQFYDLTRNTGYDLTLNNDITVSNELRLESGTLTDGGNTLHARGDVWMDITHNWGGTGDGILLDGSEQQNLRTTGTFGKLSVDNYEGIYLPTGNTIEIDDALQLENGILDIGKNLLVLDSDAQIIEANAFSVNNMIQTNISFTDAGVKKYFPAISSTTSFTYPIGSAGKYTPVEVTIDSKDAGGYLRVKAANERHPTIINDDEPCQEIADTANVLQYHWLVEAGGISGFTGEATMQYYPEDYQENSSFYDVTDYITARLLLGSTQWNKYGPNGFDESNQLLRFNFSNNDDNGISGDYTAGVEDQDGSCEGAIPDEIPAYVTVSDGSWSDSGIWDTYPTSGGTVPAGGPKGAVTLIEHSVTVPENYLISYRTTIDTGGVDNDALLMLNQTFGHRLGIVDGTGTLQIKRGALPAGIYDDFFGPDGGTLEYAGADNYDVLSEITAVNNLKFSGTGARRLPNLDVELYGNLLIDGDDATLNLLNEHDHALTVDSNIVYTAGSLEAGSGSGARLILAGDQTQEITGDFSSPNDWHHVELNNASDVIVHDHLGLDGELTFTGGKLLVDDAALVSVNNTSTTAINGASSQRYVDGDLRKDFNGGDSFTFPVGDLDRFGEVELVAVQSSGYWQARYYNEDPTGYGYDTSQRATPLETVSGNEFWEITGPGSTADVKIRWDDQSVLPAATDDREANLHIAEWITGTPDQWESVGNTVVDNGVNSGTVQTNSSVALEQHVFTLASEESAPQATAAFSTGDTTVCEGNDLELVVDLTGDPDWALEIALDGSLDTTIAGISTSPYTIVYPSVTTSDEGTYSIQSVSDQNGTGNVYGDDVQVIVGNIPTAYNVTGGGNICSDESVAIGLDGSEVGVEYELYRDGVFVQTTSGTGSSFDFGTYSTDGNYTVEATGAEGCTNTMTGSASISVTPVPDPEPSADQNPVCYDTGLSVPFYANDAGGADTYSWTPTGDLSDPSIADPEYQPSSNPNSVADTTWFYIEVTNNGCTGLDSLQMILQRQPETGNQYFVPNEFDQQ